MCYLEHSKESQIVFLGVVLLSTPCASHTQPLTTMRIIQVKSAGLLADEARKRLEKYYYPDVNTAMADLKVHFPNHLVSSEDGYLRVTNRDKSVTVALFKQEKGQPEWLNTNFGIQGTPR